MKNPFATKSDTDMHPGVDSKSDGNAPAGPDLMAEKTQTTTEPINAYAPPEPSSSSPPPPPPPPPESPSKQEQGVVDDHHKPNKGRLVVRFWQAIAAVGAFGFQIGASSYAGTPFLFDDAKLQYYTYAIDLVSLLWALFMIYVYLTRRFGSNTGKVKRPIAFAVDTALAALFGVATFYQFATYNCPPGQYNGW
ncbi:hypothetical protein [Absidia glauca]|uniref:MARVEL domain-containing protein n=1 Tax=Absidia glauca TaxID=4829 RepID=A0A163JYH5_ABSGL|nr:hypothetical protein [Absidia glauca]